MLDSIKQWNERRKERQFVYKLLDNATKLIERRAPDSKMRDMIVKKIDVNKIQSEIIVKMMKILKISSKDAVEAFSTLKDKNYEDIAGFREKIIGWGYPRQYARAILGFTLLNWKIKSPELELFLIYLQLIND
ncbi:MAG: hypothetical protein AVW06_03110 [Hadesarchaea archaeon DG-33-1]|nr:MAG: hypothetical protein AVW06_03110 [Hadesarchaea archaeon DG-33-1]